MTHSADDAKWTVDAWYLGKTSAMYETDGYGVGTISTGRDDHGGVSYGAYQLSTGSGTLHDYLEQSSYKKDFEGLQPATPAFDAKWRELANREPGFASEQHEFIRRTHYDVQVDRLRAAGIDLSDRGRAVQDALWSTSVQFRGFTGTIVADGLKEKFGANYALSQLSDKDIVEAMQDYKIAHNKTLFKSSPKSWDGLLRRAREERAELVQLASYDNALAREGRHSDWRQSVLPPSNIARAQTDEEGTIGNIQQNLAHLGIADAHGRALIPDGHYGPATRHAIETFQRQHNLSVNGLANEETLVATKAAASMAQPTPPALDHGTVKALQQNLARLGATDHQGHTLHDDGFYGERTSGAVAAFQQQYGLPVTGVADLATMSTVQALVTADDVQQQSREREAVQAPVSPSLNADIIRTLQTHLNTLGVTDMNQQAVAVTGVYDLSTHTAVARFQAEQGMPVTDHPDHALYTALQRRIPDASDDRLVQFTAACRKVKINADNLGDILLNEKDLTITFVAKGSLGPFTDVDLKQAPPTPEQSMRQVQAHEQDQAQKWTQFHERQREINTQAQHGPVLGRPPLLH